MPLSHMMKTPGTPPNPDEMSDEELSDLFSKHEQYCAEMRLHAINLDNAPKMRKYILRGSKSGDIHEFRQMLIRMSPQELTEHLSELRDGYWLSVQKEIKLQDKVYGKRNWTRDHGNSDGPDDPPSDLRSR